MVKFVIDVNNEFFVDEYNQAVRKFLAMLPSIRYLDEVENYPIGTSIYEDEPKSSGILIEVNEEDAELIYRLIDEEICDKVKEP